MGILRDIGKGISGVIGGAIGLATGFVGGAIGVHLTALNNKFYKESAVLGVLTSLAYVGACLFVPGFAIGVSALGAVAGAVAGASDGVRNGIGAGLAAGLRIVAQSPDKYLEGIDKRANETLREEAIADRQKLKQPPIKQAALADKPSVGKQNKHEVEMTPIKPVAPIAKATVTQPKAGAAQPTPPQSQATPVKKGQSAKTVSELYAQLDAKRGQTTTYASQPAKGPEANSVQATKVGPQASTRPSAPAASAPTTPGVTNPIPNVSAVPLTATAPVPPAAPKAPSIARAAALNIASNASSGPAMVRSSDRATLPPAATTMKATADSDALLGRPKALSETFVGKLEEVLKGIPDQSSLKVGKSDNWDENIRMRSINVEINDKPAFNVYSDRVTSNSAEIDAFKAMIVTFQTQYPGKDMEIKTTPELKETWMKACQDMNVTSGNIKTPKESISLADPAPSQAYQAG